MKTAAYARYSSDQQRDASINDQLRNVRAWCERNDMPTPTVYTDAAVSGSRLDRPGYQSLIAAAERGEVDILIVDDISRLSRDQLETGRVVRLFRHLGIRLIGISDGLDTARKGYKIEVGLRGLMSELYLDDLADKTHRGLTGLAMNGFSAGGLPYGYGSRQEGNGFKRIIKPDEAAVIVWIYEQFTAGKSPLAIAKELNEKGIKTNRGGTWSRTAIWGDHKRGIGILANPIYKGQYVWNRSRFVKDPKTGRRLRKERPPAEWIIQQDESLRIVSNELWEAAKSRATSLRIKSAPPTKSKFLFSGLLRCGLCGSNYVIVDRYRYGCLTHKDRGAAACSNDRKVPRITIETTLLREIKQNLLSADAYRLFEAEVHKLLRENKPDLTRVKRLIADAEKSRDNVMKAIMVGIITPTTKQALEKAESEINQYREELAAAEQYSPDQILPRAKEIYKRIVDRLESIDDVTAAREAIKDVLGDIAMIPDSDGGLLAEMPSSICQISMVAGARFCGNLTSKTMRVKLV